jgi:uncharacterized membrane protein
MANKNSRIEKYKRYRMMIQKMNDGNQNLSSGLRPFFLNQEHLSWLMTVIFALIATVTIIVLALVAAGSFL